MTMEKVVHIVWCELDIGQDNVAFSSVSSAAAWARMRVSDSDCERSYDELLEAGLIGTTERELDPHK